MISNNPQTNLMYGQFPYPVNFGNPEWSDWRWQLSHRLNTAEELEKIIHLTDSERQALRKSGLFRVDITPYFASLMDPDDPNCPIRRCRNSTRTASRKA